MTLTELLDYVDEYSRDPTPDEIREIFPECTLTHEEACRAVRKARMGFIREAVRVFREERQI